MANFECMHLQTPHPLQFVSPLDMEAFPHSTPDAIHVPRTPRRGGSLVLAPRARNICRRKLKSCPDLSWPNSAVSARVTGIQVGPLGISRREGYHSNGIPCKPSPKQCCQGPCIHPSTIGHPVQGTCRTLSMLP